MAACMLLVEVGLCANGSAGTLTGPSAYIHEPDDSQRLYTTVLSCTCVFHVVTAVAYKWVCMHVHAWVGGCTLQQEWSIDIL